jgi:hypothetical protein
MERNRISEILDRYTRSWEVITITDPNNPNRTIDVVPPYVIAPGKNEKDNSYVNSAHRQGPAWKRYVDELTDLQKELDNPGNVDRTGSIRGKARPEVIKAFLEKEGKNLFNEVYDGKKCTDLRESLIYYGIGVDCSGFVSRAIGQVMYELNTSPEIKFKTLWYNTDDIKKYSPTTDRPYRSNCTKLENEGSVDVSPEDIRPGDILYNRSGSGFHVRIVLETLENDGNEFYFITAESSSPLSIRRVLRKKWKYVKNGNKMYYAFYKQNGELGDYTREDNWNKSGVTFKFRRPWAFVNYVDNTQNTQACRFEENYTPSYYTPGYSKPSYSTSAYSQPEETNSSFQACFEPNAETTSNANLRKDSSTRNSPIKTIPKGAKIYVDFSRAYKSDTPKPNSTWYKVSYNDLEGYLCDITFKATKTTTTLTEEKSTPANSFSFSTASDSTDPDHLSKNDIKFAMTTSNANFRPTASTKQKEYFQIPKDTILPFNKSTKVVSDSPKPNSIWYKFNYNNIDGYLCDTTFASDLTPIYTGLINPYSSCAQIIIAFNSGSSSRRIFNEVHYYPDDPHITIGFGHFAGSTQDTFIKSMVENSKMRQILINEFSKGFLKNKDFINQAKEDGFNVYFDPSTNSVSGVKELLSKLKLEGEFVNASKDGKFPGGGKKSGYWLNDILVEALLNRYICAWQIKFWLEHTLQDAKDFARELGCAEHYGLVASLASLRSSGLMNKEVIRPLVGFPRTAEEKDKAAVKLWAYYNKKKGKEKTRSRQKAIFSRWFEKSWTIVRNEECPQSIDDFRYKGVPMDTDPSGIAFAVSGTDPYVELIK